MKDLTAYVVRIPHLFRLRGSFDAIGRIFTAFTIIAIIAPLCFPFHSASQIQKNDRAKGGSAPAPAESFKITDHPAITDRIHKFLNEVSRLVIPAKKPEGLEISREPGLLEKAGTGISSAMSLFAATRSAVSAPPAPPPTGETIFDFDGDQRSDIGRWRSAASGFDVRLSNGGTSSFALSSPGKAAPADYNGDGITDAAVFYAGTWVYKTAPGGTSQTVSFGTSGDIPVSGDYNGDGIDDFAVYRPTTGVWYVKTQSGHAATAWGMPGDIPVQGDYDGDGKTDQAVFRPSEGNWYVNRSRNGYYALHWGIAIDTPVPADFDGDGKTDPAIYRPTTGEWFAYKSSAGDGTYIKENWGSYGDQPLAGYFDDDAVADFAVWRPNTGGWYIKYSTGAYDYAVLGTLGDQPVNAAYIKQIGSPIPPNQLNKERLKAANAVGATDLYSQNFSWEAGLVHLPGRSGFDLDIGISYNSSTWLRVDDTMVFDPDISNVSPGFRLGFPVIEPAFFGKEKDAFSYLMVAPSGKRIEFRQTAASNVYDAVDSSYARLETSGTSGPNDPVENVTIKVTSTNGTQMAYEWKAGAFRCKQVKDRNGNYLTVTHTDFGGLESVTDTLGRVVNINYTNGESPSSITQTWKNSNGAGANVTHNWATFTYTYLEIDTNFGSLGIFGPMDGTNISVLQKIQRSDGSYTTFDHTSWGQVRQINEYAADGHKLSHTALNLPANASAPQPDCPHFTQISSYVENFNGGNETVMNVSRSTGQTYSLPGNISGTATKIQTWLSGHPNNLRTNLFVSEGGWGEGLPLASEDCITTSAACSERVRWSWQNWLQDDPNVDYPVNPRITEERIGDSANVKRTTTSYLIDSETGLAKYGLPETVTIYGADLTTPEKQVRTEYNLASAYIARRIIGLPKKREIYGREAAGLVLVGKQTFGFDEGDFGSSTLNQNILPVNHDSSNYGAGFITGRGNPTSATRWNVNYPESEALAVRSSTKFNTAGSPVAKIDARGRVSKIGYLDDWNDSVTRSTFAYPTALTDAGGFSSTVKYRHDLGANVWARSPAPYDPSGVGNPYGKTTSRIYSDTNGRISKQKVDNNGAYVRYEYASSGTSIDTFSTIVDVNNDSSINSSDEVRSTVIFDGAGRARMSRTENPGSTGGYTGSLTEYNILGQAWRSTVPTEIDSSWNPAGDDYRGMSGNGYNWLWNSAEFDWKGRTTREINTDGTDRVYTFDGCGCAGQVVTVKGEITEAIDNASGSLQTGKRRTQKIYTDILGRTTRTEIWDLDGAGSAPYSTTTYTYNGRDQATLTRQYSGNTSGSFQDTTQSFDGHGRLASIHQPQERDAGNNPTYTSFSYNADDSIATKTDPRGATILYSYGNIDDASPEYRPFLTKISFSAPVGSNIPVPGSITYTFDPAGNRKTMADDSGNISYTYDQLSLLKTETKDFTDNLENAPAGGVYTLSYDYHLNGGLRAVTDPFNSTVTYAADKIGRITAVGGSGAFSGETEVTNYASNVSHRAFGGVKSMSYETEDPTHISYGYDNRLRISSYEAESSVNNDDIFNKSYTYNGDNSLKTAADAIEASITQNNQYDFAGRLRKNEFFSGVSGTAKPYSQTLGYDAFTNITSRSTKMDGKPAANYTATFVNNRRTSGGYNSGTNTFDAAGNVIQNYVSGNDTRTWTFDASGKVSAWSEFANFFTGPRMDVGAYNTFDGDGRLAKRVDRRRNPASGNTTWYEQAEYTIFSSVTGNAISELNKTGARKKLSVYLGGTLIAAHEGDAFSFKHADPVTGATKQTDDDGLVNPYGIGRSNPEAFGANITPDETEIQGEGFDYRKDGNVSNPEAGCRLIIGAPVNCNDLPVGPGGEIYLPGGGILTEHVVKGNNNAPVPPGGNPSGAYGTADRLVYTSTPLASGSRRPDVSKDSLKIDEGADAVRRALGNSMCRNFISRGNKYYGNPMKIFETLLQNGNIAVGTRYSIDRKGGTETFRDKNVAAVTWAGMGNPIISSEGLKLSASMITVNQSGPFFSLRTTAGKHLSTLSQFAGMTDEEIRGALLMHELAHFYGSIPSDGRDNAQSVKNSGLVRLLCFSSLARAMSQPIESTETSLQNEIGQLPLASLPVGP